MVAMLTLTVVLLTCKPSERMKTLSATAEQFVIDHYVLLLVALMLALPLLVQGIYSIPLLRPTVSADAVLAFWGVLLGIVGAAFSHQKQLQNERHKRVSELSPAINVELHHCADGMFKPRITNHKGYPYTLACLCGQPRSEILGGNCSLEVQLKQVDFESFNAEHIRSLKTKGIDAADKPKTLSLELYDPDGNRWHIDYEYSSPKGLTETFRFFVACADC